MMRPPANTSIDLSQKPPPVAAWRPALGSRAFSASTLSALAPASRRETSALRKLISMTALPVTE